MKLGFIGLGKMGAAMARNLLKAGHQVKVYNRTRDKADALAKEGAQPANNPQDAAYGSEAVFTMLSDDNALAASVWGDSGLAAGLDANSVHIGSSTVSVEMARRLAEQHSKRGQAYVSAPVFGRPDAAENKRLVVVGAGDRDILDRVQPLFDDIGRKTFQVGAEPWQANAIKLCGNFMIASMIEAFSEAVTTIRKSGVDPQQFLTAIAEVFGSPVYQNYGKQIVDRRFEVPGGGFGLSLGLKDVRLVCDFAESVTAPMPLANLLREHFISALANGQEHLDWTSVAQVISRAAGVS